MDALKPDRDAAITDAITTIRGLLSEDVNIAQIDAAKAVLLDLCAKEDLFTFDAFPLPPEGAFEKTYLIHCEEDGGYALYVNAGRPGQSYRPHDHGGAWAIVAGVRGEETHRVFSETRDPNAPIAHKADLTVAPGKAISLLPDGIHAISAEGDTPLLHLHLYATRFENQGTRTEYDEATGERFSFKLENLGEIVDAR